MQIHPKTQYRIKIQLKMNQRNKSTTLLIIFLIVIFSPFLLTWIIDPIQHYHKSWIIPNKGIKDNERDQISGRVRHYMNADPSYDTVIIGASNAQNLEPSRVADALHSKKAMSLAISGAAPVLQSKVLEFAFREANFKNVLWVIAPNWRERKDIDIHANISPNYLLDNNIFNDIKYVYSIKMYKSWFKIILDTQIIKKSISKINIFKEHPMFKKTWVTNFENVPMWSSLNSKEAYSHANKIMEVSLKKFKPKIQEVLEKTKNGEALVFQKSIVDKQIIDKTISENYWLPKLVSNNPDTRFVFLVPSLPFSFYLTKGTPNERSEHFFKARRLLKLLGRYKNVEIHAQSTPEILGNLNNYQDLSHPILPVQRNTLKLISKGKIKITNLTIDKYEKELILGINAIKIENISLIPEKIRPLSFEGSF